MADYAPSGTESPQNQNELNQAEPIFLEEEAVNEEAEEEEEADEEYTSHLESIIELYSEGDEEDKDEACSLADECSEGNRWSDTQIDGLFCPICMEAWTNNGDHHICCLPCGHIYGMSCIQKWLQQCQNQAKCPQCNRRCKMKDVRKLFASRVVAIDDEAQKRIQSLENKCASLEKKRAGWTKKEAKWRKIEAELQVGVQQLRENLAKLVQQSSEYEQQMVQKLTEHEQRTEQRFDEVEQKMAEYKQQNEQWFAKHEQKLAGYKRKKEQLAECERQTKQKLAKREQRLAEYDDWFEKLSQILRTHSSNLPKIPGPPPQNEPPTP